MKTKKKILKIIHCKQDDSGSVQMYRKKETIKNQPLQFL